MITELNFTQPDDFHLHLRDDIFLVTTVTASATVFGRAIVMPNLKPAVTTVDEANSYKKRISAAIPEDLFFQPLMTLYLTDNTDPDQVAKAAQDPDVFAYKLYPAGATTNSAAGVTCLKSLDDTLAAMVEYDLPLLIHGETTDESVDIFDREAVFIENVLQPLLKRHSKLRVVLEHITTENAVEFVTSAAPNIAATITPQHLLYDRNHMLVGGIKPHFYCLPILKRALHRKALLKAATSGNPKFFLGTDSAPHLKHDKESSCGCAGCYSAPFAIQLYAEIFEGCNALDKLEGFSSHFGADFYGLPKNRDQITLFREKFIIPEKMIFGNGHIVPLAAGSRLNWSVC